MLAWYRELNENVVVLVELMAAELATFQDYKSTQKVMSTLASGLYSTNVDVTL